MAELRHLLSQDSMLILRAVQAKSEDPEVVELMTRHELYDHLAIRGRLGADENEVVSKVQRWKDARDLNRIMAKASKIVRTKAEISQTDNLAKRAHLTERLEGLQA